MVSVQIISNATSRLVKNARVSIEFIGWTRGFSDTKYTDANGIVDFSNDPGECIVYVDGKEQWGGRLSGMQPVYIK